MPMGAHVAQLVRAPTHHCSLLFLLLAAFLLLASTLALSEQVPEYGPHLLKFKNSLVNATSINWDPKTRPCDGREANWKGVLCSPDNNIWGLQLEGMGLMGTIDIEALSKLPLVTISLMNNNFDTPLPNFKILKATLKTLYLSNNMFSGVIPDEAFAGMTALRKVNLDNNQFIGRIPSSLTALPRLVELRLERNHFTGLIPNFQQSKLRFANFSYNQLEGPIPSIFSKLDATSFSGNINVCGLPLNPCPDKQPSVFVYYLNEHTGLATAVVVLSVVLGLAIICIIVLFVYRKPQVPPLSSAMTSTGSSVVPTAPHETRVERRSSTVQKRSDYGKLTFVNEDRDRFELQDLLKAAAEVLGSGAFGSSYKAVVRSGDAVVVKRYRQMNNVGREEFQEHMRRIGRLRHPNLLPLVAYYYRKEERLLISDFVENSSLAGHLHGNHGEDQPALDWPTRLRIIKGVVKALAYLYKELPSMIVPHGHLKSSNVLLDESFEPLLTDYGLVPVINPTHAQQLMVSYKSPEYKRQRMTNKKTDIWSLGVLILEILTGKFPTNFIAQGSAAEGDDGLSSWVRTTIGVEEEWRTQVFDKEIGDTHDAEGEMLNLLRIGLSCCEEDVKARWDISQVVEEIDGLKERDAYDCQATPCANAGEE